MRPADMKPIKGLAATFETWIVKKDNALMSEIAVDHPGVNLNTRTQSPALG